MNESQARAEIAAKLVEVARTCQPNIQVVGNTLQFKFKNKAVQLPLFQAKTVSTRSLINR